MAVLGTPIIDTDSHLIEPPDLWTSRLPAAWGDQIMTVRWNEERQTEFWTVNNQWLSPAWMAVQFGYNKYPEGPARYENCYPGSVEQAGRVKVMDESGVISQVLYPNVAGLNAALFEEMSDQRIAEAHICAYNDYQVDYAAAYPGRFIPMLIVPFWRIEGAVEEIERMTGKGFGGVVMTGAPQLHRLPYIGDPHWDRLWSACLAAGFSVSFHIANGDMRGVLREESPHLDLPGATLARTATWPFLDNGKQITDLLLSGVLVRFPELKFASVESGIGWVPFVLESLDYHYKRATHDIDQLPWGDLLPSDLFRRQVYVNYWFERLQPWHLEAVGEDNIMFETDFPHPTCLGPADVGEVLEFGGLSEVTTEQRDKILWKNAARLYGIDVAEIARRRDTMQANHT